MAELEQEDFLDALATLARKKRTGLVRAATGQGVSAEDALECVQDALCTFMGLYKNGKLSAPRDKWAPLLFGIVRNAARNKRRLFAVARPHEASADLQHSDAPPADEVLIREKEHLRLRVCVAKLCEIERAVIMLRLLSEQPGDDVAKSLGISRGYVDVLIHRAKASLRACILRQPS